MKPEIVKTADVIIIGSGSAGLFAALTLAQPKNGRPAPRVLVLSEKPLGGVCASAWAQGGIAIAVDKDDTTESHVADTLKAAAGTADVHAVRALVEDAPHYVRLLEKLGVQFDRNEDGTFRLNREACHARRRVLKAAAGDGFGRELMRALSEAVRHTPQITFVEGVSAERLIRRDGNNAGPLQGVLARRLSDGKPVVFAAPAVLLATGGIGGLFVATSNPLHALGRGVAMAARAGAVLADLEFVQFHPTVLDIGEDPCPLATEALRGEGAHLLNSRGERFMPAYHPAAELAPRDVVSRGIFAQIMRGQKVYLDCRHIDTSHFPALLQAAARAKLNPARDLIPVMPAVHYHMGGVSTDLAGRSSVNGLWVAGETGSTGLHGANRLASNSLMEAIVMGARAGADIAAYLETKPETSAINAASLPELPVGNMDAERHLIRQIMTDLVGVIRAEEGMKHAIEDLAALQANAKTRDAKTEDMALVARMIAVAALKRTESRGGHCRSDYPETLPQWQKRSFTTLKEIEAQTAQTLAPPARVAETAA
ncbi:MAG: L-aspartate oxidase [Alphaproteobacteria bacterium]|nr:L-aspartate oxidase [Alphaproteobacteria bacterium]